jgi:hypothetical protein
MIYDDAQSWAKAPQKQVLLFGMSGLGKTHVSNILRGSGDWFHYSVDYRIGTRYMGELIADNAKAQAMQVLFLRDLLLSDSIYIGSNITFDNLSPVSTYLGKPGNPAKGGLPFAEYTRRQDQFRQSEVSALLDTGGSICEWVDPDDMQDPIMTALADSALMVWVEGTAAHTAELIRRFDRAPKPMAYQPAFLARVWEEYLNENKVSEGDVDPDAFIRWTYAQALAHRQPRYAAMARHWGVSVTAEAMGKVRTTDDFNALIGAALAARS